MFLIRIRSARYLRSHGRPNISAIELYIFLFNKNDYFNILIVGAIDSGTARGEAVLNFHTETFFHDVNFASELYTRVK